MNLLLFLKLLPLTVIFASFLATIEANVDACSSSNTNIEIDAQLPGKISTPAFPNGYSGGSCIWKIQAPVNFRLAITIEVLQFKSWDDYLVIRDGDGSSSPLIGKYGPCASGSVTLFSSGRSAFLQTVSAVFSSSDKLSIAYRAINPDDIDCSNQAENPPNYCSENTKLKEVSGVLSSPNFPNNYDADEYCLWEISAPQGYRIQAEVLWFGVEDYRYSRPGLCQDDYLVITEYLGNSSADNIVARLCGCKETYTYISPKEKMWFSFYSYKKANWPGFYVRYQVLAPEECPADETNCSLKTMAPVGFNAQGQVCSFPALPTTTSAQMMTSSVAPSLPPSSETPLPKKSTLAVQEIASAITYSEISLTGSYMWSSAKASSQAEKASKLEDKTTEALALVTGSTESASEARISALKTKTLITSPPTHRGLISDAKSSKNVESTRGLFMTSMSSSTEGSSSREVALPQKPTGVISPSPIATSTLTVMRDRDQDSTIASSLLGISEDPFVTTKANFRSNHIKILDHATSSVKSTQMASSISGAPVVEVKESDAGNPAVSPSPTATSTLSMRGRDQDSAMLSSMLGRSEDPFVTTNASFRPSHTKILDHTTNSVKSTQTASGISGASVVKVKESDTEDLAVSPSPTATSTLTMRDGDQDSTIAPSLLGISEDPFVTKKANFRSNHTKILDHATSSVKSTQTASSISGASVVEVKESDTENPPVAQLKKSRSSLFSAQSIKMKVSTMASYKIENIKPSVSGETKASKTTDRKYTMTPEETMVEWLPSITVNQSSTLAVRGTEPVLKTTSLAGTIRVVSHHSDYVTSASQSIIIQPSETSEGSEDTPYAMSVIVTQKPPANTTDVLFIEGAPEGISVKCTHYAIEIIISRIQQPKLDISTVHLQDPLCKVASSNDTHALLTSPLESCDTELRMSKFYFIYSNSLMGDTRFDDTAEITRDGRLKFEFQCLYRRIHVLSIISYSSRQKVAQTDGDGVGNFSFGMDLFEDSKYDVVVSQYPFNVHPGQRMYFKVDVKSNDRDLVAFLDECWVTPSTNPRDQTRYTIIEKGCPRDPTLLYNYEKSAIQKFSIKAFRFRRFPTSRLYVHCEVETCRSTDTDSVCETGCVENGRRRRENKPYIMDRDLFLSLGPVNLQQKKPAESQMSFVYVKALIGLLGVISLILLTAIAVILIKRRKRGYKTCIWFASRTLKSQDGNETNSKLMTTEL